MSETAQQKYHRISYANDKARSSRKRLNYPDGGFNLHTIGNGLNDEFKFVSNHPTFQEAIIAAKIIGTEPFHSSMDHPLSDNRESIWNEDFIFETLNNIKGNDPSNFTEALETINSTIRKVESDEWYESLEPRMKNFDWSFEYSDANTSAQRAELKEIKEWLRQFADVDPVRAAALWDSHAQYVARPEFLPPKKIDELQKQLNGVFSYIKYEEIGFPAVGPLIVDAQKAYAENDLPSVRKALETAKTISADKHEQLMITATIDMLEGVEPRRWTISRHETRISEEYVVIGRTNSAVEALTLFQNYTGPFVTDNQTGKQAGFTHRVRDGVAQEWVPSAKLEAMAYMEKNGIQLLPVRNDMSDADRKLTESLWLAINYPNKNSFSHELLMREVVHARRDAFGEPLTGIRSELPDQWSGRVRVFPIVTEGSYEAGDISGRMARPGEQPSHWEVHVEDTAGNWQWFTSDTRALAAETSDRLNAVAELAGLGMKQWKHESVQKQPEVALTSRKEESSRILGSSSLLQETRLIHDRDSKQRNKGSDAFTPYARGREQGGAHIPAATKAPTLKSGSPAADLQQTARSRSR